MDYIEPNPCCDETWRKLDIWDNSELPDELICPVCRNKAIFIPWQRKLDGALKDVIHLEGFNIKWYPPGEEDIM